jgi:hypothetical protein
MRTLVRRFLQLERSFQGYRPPTPTPTALVPDRCTPEGARALLEALALLYRPGEALTLAQIAIAARRAAIPKNSLSPYRRWLRAQGRWPYRDAFQRPDGRRGGNTL